MTSLIKTYKHFQENVQVLLTYRCAMLICLFVLFGKSLFALGTDNKYSIKHISTKDGLSFNQVTAIIEDKEGFMWFATRGGLNRWDGKEFRIFKGIPGDNTSLSPSIESLFQDSKNRIWIGTKTRGAFYYEPQTETFHQIPFSDKRDALTSTDKQIIAISEDKQNNIWLGGFSHGLNKIDDKGHIRYFLNYQTVGGMIPRDDGSMWIADTQGLMRISADNKSSRLFRHNNQDYIGYTDLIEDPESPIIWLTGWTSGLIKYNYETGAWKEYKIPNSPNTYTLTMDQDRNIWIGCWGQGLWRFNPLTEEFTHIYDESNGVNSDVILSLYCDHNGDIWTGTSNGVLKISQPLPFYNKQPNVFSSDEIISLFIDDGRTFVSSQKKGLFVSEDGDVYSKFSGKAQTWCFSDRLKNGNIICGDNEGIAEITDKKYHLLNTFSRGKNGELVPYYFTKIRALHLEGERLWAGSQQKGLCCFEWKDNILIESTEASHRQLNNLLNTKRISSILKDSKNTMWVGTYEGLYFKNPKSESFHSVLELTEGMQMSNDIVLCIREDGAGNLWIGTPLGLTKLSPQRNGQYQLNYYTKSDGLSDDYIQAIETDNGNNIWISHNKGISSINIIDDEIFNYDESNGILSNSFKENTSFKKDEFLYFVGDRGIAFFNPQNIWVNERIPLLAFTNLFIQNRKVNVGEKVGGSVILKKALNHTEEITLNYGKNAFSVGFSAMNFDAPEKNQYQYKLEGRDKQWATLGVNNRLSLNNLKPGNYTLQIKGSNNNNIWNEEGRSLKIKILPPFWISWYAFLIYLTIILIILFFIRWNLLIQSRLNKKVDLTRLQSEKEHEVNELKLRFYTNISHEFRTPLTLILGPVNELLSIFGNLAGKEEKTTRKLIGIKRNAQDLLHLVNQLLDFRKAETDHYKLKVQETEILPFFQSIFAKYEELADLQNVVFRFHFSNNNTTAWLDRDKMVKIVNNLLSNAFKYLKDDDRQISVDVTDSETHLILKVRDNGLGIPQDKIEKIFNRFYQLEESPSLNSSGIGLSLVNHFAQLHHGKISVHSIVNEHTVFTLEIPVQKEQYSKEDRSDLFEPLLPIEPNFTEPELSNELIKSPAIQIKDGLKLLIVEDNKEVRDYVKELFETEFEVLTAVNGLEGFDIALKKSPALIISDVMMPEMDGFELCRQLKSNAATETIPIILLTAKSSNEARVYGTKEGADAYIPKPFDPDFLRVKVASILESREKLKSEFSKKVVLGPSEIEVTSYEGELIEKAIVLIEENLSNSDFDMDAFSDAMHMSKTTLYRRIKNLTGKSPSEFVRSIRIKRAEKLMHDRGKTISEIAWETGFSEPKIFRNAFEKEFSMKPMKYRQKLDEESKGET